jgi:hypothetical protein
MWVPRRFLASLLVAIPAALACTSDDLTQPTTGSLEITTATSGAEVDPDGYSVQVDAGQPRIIGASATLQDADLAPGNHTVQLAGIAANCSVAGDNPRTVSVTVGVTTPVSFEVTCIATTGTLEITTVTTGESLDPDGFTVSVDNGQSRPILTTATVTIQSLSAGPHTVVLDNVADNCTPAEGPSQTVTVSPGVTTLVGFTITCSFAGATRWTSIPLPPTVTAETGWYTSRTLWGTSPTDLFVVGWATEPYGRWGIWHYDGQAWTEQVSSVDTALVGIWGSSATDVFAIGRGPRGEANKWGDPNQPGAILHYDGVRWSDMPGPMHDPGFNSIRYTGIWGAAARSVFLGGSLYRSTPATELLASYDGMRWSEMRTPRFGDYTHFTDLAGSSATDVWAIGSRQKCADCNYDIATIVHYDGNGWKEGFTKSNDFFHGIWATAANDVWVVGENAERNANVLHFDGISWSRGEPLATSEYGLKDVWASSASDVYAVGPAGFRSGSQGILLRYDGIKWTTIPNVGGDRVWGTSQRDVFVLRANEILHGTP